MFCICPVGNPLGCSFFSDYSEAESLLLFSQRYGFADVVVFESPHKTSCFDSYSPRKFISARKFEKIISGLTLPEYEQLKVSLVNKDE